MLEDLPQPILDDILSCVSFKRDYTPSPENLQVKELLFCLRQSYLRRVNPKPITSLRTALKIYSGMLWDQKFSSLFPVNQRNVSYKCQNCRARINGRYDFLDVDDTVTELKKVEDVNIVEKAAWANQQQVRFYAYADCRSRAQILYFDGHDAKRFPVSLFNIDRSMGKLEDNAKIFYECLVNGVLPDKTVFSKACLNCEFRGAC